MVEIFVTRESGVAVVDFAAKEVLDMAKAATVGRHLSDLVERGDLGNVLIDFRNVKLMTSTMINELLQVRKKCADHRVHLKFCSLSHELTDLFKKLKLDKTFEIYGSRGQALKAFQPAKRADAPKNR